MGHRTTLVEFSMKPADLFAVAETWANKFNFSLYERSLNRAIYSKSIRLMKAWVAVENNGENAKLEAWLSGPGVGPDFIGNAWRGWKIALPPGRLGFGPLFIFRKQFDALLDLLKSKTPNAIQEKAFQRAPTLDKSILAKGMTILGILILVMGAMNLLAAMSFLLKPAFPDPTTEIWVDGAFSVVNGILILTSSRALAKGKIMAIWLYGGSIVMDAIYNITLGRPMNYWSIGFGALFIWQMFKFKDEWKLS